MKHRSDIDGLRAVAVLPVLGFHAGVRQLAGGFAGVDVFFVISGFLIGSLILTELDEERFSVASFYSRRLRRILPALAVMLAATAAAGAAILYPVRLVALGQSMLAAALSASNIYFQMTSGYFDAPSSTKPLLHTWSLSVEEQFYLLVPTLLVLTQRYLAAFVRPVLILIAVVSLLASAIGAYEAPTFTFYELPTRAWELLMGTLVGLYPPPSGRQLREAIAAGGLLLIGAAVILYKPGMPFPGLAALVPCGGAAMVIWAGSSGTTGTGRVLAWPPLAFIGLISYSLYLWHWPVIVLYQQVTGRPLGFGDAVRCIALSLVAATVSWRYVERPFRLGAPSRRRVFATAAVALTALVAAASLLVGLDGLPFRFAPAENRIASYLDYSPRGAWRRGSCFIGAGNTFADFDKASCLNGFPDRRNILILGDSHGAHLYYGLARQLPGQNVLQATAARCRPTLARPADDEAPCAALMAYMFDRYLPTHPMDMVILAGRWRESDLDDLGKTLDWAKAKRIPIMLQGPIVEYDQALPFLIVKGLREGRPDLPQRHITPGQAALDRAMAALAAAKGVPYASPYRALCSPSGCLRIASDGAPLQYDAAHLTREGSLLVARSYVEEGLFNPVTGDVAELASDGNQAGSSRRSP